MKICDSDPNQKVDLHPELINGIVQLGNKISKTSIDVESIAYSEMNFRSCEFYTSNPKEIYPE